MSTTRIAALTSMLLIASIARAEIQVITAERMFDARQGHVTGPATLVISDGVIEAVNPESLPPDAERLDLGDRTLLPGLFDMHTHVTMDFFTGDDWVTAPVKETAADWAIRGVKFANLTLQAG